MVCKYLDIMSFFFNVKIAWHVWYVIFVFSKCWVKVLTLRSLKSGMWVALFNLGMTYCFAFSYLTGENFCVTFNCQTTYYLHFLAQVLVLWLLDSPFSSLIVATVSVECTDFKAFLCLVCENRHAVTHVT